MVCSVLLSVFLLSFVCRRGSEVLISSFNQLCFQLNRQRFCHQTPYTRMHNLLISIDKCLLSLSSLIRDPLKAIIIVDSPHAAHWKDEAKKPIETETKPTKRTYLYQFIPFYIYYLLLILHYIRWLCRLHSWFHVQHFGVCASACMHLIVRMVLFFIALKCNNNKISFIQVDCIIS